MKVIDLLNKIEKGEEVPKKIKKTWVYEWSFDEVRDDFTYITKEGCRFDEDWFVLDILDGEVEIIEKPKNIKKLDENNTNVLTNIIENRKKINEIIDKLNEMEKE